MKKYKAILYDIDGTILNTLNMNLYPLIRIIKEETGEEWTFEDVLKFAAYPGMKVMEELHIQNKEKTYQRWVQYVNEYEEGAILYDDFETIFQSFEDHHIIQAVVSSKTRKQYQLDFVDKNLHRYMSAAILAEDTKEHKPNPEPLLKCLQLLQLEPQDVIYIGDALSDSLAAQNAHIDFGYAMWGGLCHDQIQNPTYIFKEPQDLLQLLDYKDHS